jgi:hypothetical protein
MPWRPLLTNQSSHCAPGARCFCPFQDEAARKILTHPQALGRKVAQESCDSWRKQIPQSGHEVLARPRSMSPITALNCNREHRIDLIVVPSQAYKLSADAMPDRQNQLFAGRSLAAHSKISAAIEVLLIVTH